MQGSCAYVCVHTAQEQYIQRSIPTEGKECIIKSATKCFQSLSLLTLSTSHNTFIFIRKRLVAGVIMLFDRHPEFRDRYGRHFWARGYYVETIGNVNEEVIRRYIAEQEESDRRGG